MKFQSPSLSEMHAFLAVFEQGSFRKAAGVLCVTQAAVSRAVLRLEERLGCSLFERTAFGIAPTARGREFQNLVQGPVAALENSIMSFRRRTDSRKLRVSVITTLATRWLVPRLADFHASHPNLNLELRPYRPADNYNRDDVDLWIDVMRSQSGWPRGFKAHYLLGKEITPVCTPEIASRLREPRDLLNENLLFHTGFPNNWSLWLNKARIAHDPGILRQGFDTGNNLIVAACSGMGVPVIHPCLIENELKAGQLVRPFPMMVSTERGWYACYKRSLAHEPAVKEFVRWLQEQAAGTIR
ncbi:MAG: LysR family transcriptional regulator [Burkholderiales bacterium]|nr:LysR family transcriptional regulator [Burkholderiales bacterium]